MRSRGIVAEIKATSSGRLARFTSFTVSIAGMPKIAAPRMRASAITRSTCAGVTKGRTASCTSNDFGRGLDLRQRVRDRLLPRVAAWTTRAGRPSPAFSTLSCRAATSRARGDEKFGDRGTRRQPSQRKNNQRHAVEFEKLLGWSPPMRVPRPAAGIIAAIRFMNGLVVYRSRAKRGEVSSEKVSFTNGRFRDSRAAADARRPAEPSPERLPDGESPAAAAMGRGTWSPRSS